MKLRIGSDFSGVGSFNQALIRLGVDYEEVFACDIDKYARKVFIHNYGEPKYFPQDVYDREIPEEPLDIYVTSPPCFTGETLIFTDKGYKYIKDIKVGDNVLTHKNRFKKVVRIGSKKSSTIKILAQGVLKTTTTPDHRYYVRKMTWKWDNSIRRDVRQWSDPEWIEAGKLNKSHFIGIPIPTINENPHDIDYDLAFLLGRYVADGWYRESRGSVTLAIGESKLEEAKKMIKHKNTIKKSSKGTYKMFIYSVDLVALIKELGLGKGAINKRIPNSIINLPVEILKGFIDGYMSGDGHETNNAHKATSVSLHLMLGLQLCVAKIYRTNMNIRRIKTPDTTVIEGRTVNQRDYYVGEFRKEMKKQSHCLVENDYIWYPFRSSESGVIETVYDIEVEEDHSFTANQAVVHNCQSFSMAGKRLGEDDERGVLFYNSHEFIKKNLPRYFIFENVRGLLSIDGGAVFGRWLDLLGGKSVNGNYVLFPHEDSVPYHIYWKVLNAKDYNVPQNRNRVFIIGIRDDEDNNFRFPAPLPLEKKLKDVLEDEVDEKYYLSDKMLRIFTPNNNPSYNDKKIFGDTNIGGQRGEVIDEKSAIMSTLASTDYKQPKQIAIKSNTQSGYEIAEEGDSVDLDTRTGRRGRVGKEVSQSLEANDKMGVVINPLKDKTDKGWHFEQQVYDEEGISRAVKAGGGSGNIPKVMKWYEEESKKMEDGDIIQSGHANMKGDRIYKDGVTPTLPAENPRLLITEDELLEINKDGVSDTLSTVQKANVVVENHKIISYSRDEKGKVISRHLKDEANTIHTSTGSGNNTDQFIVGGTQKNQTPRTDGVSPTLTEAMGKGRGHTPLHNYDNYRIRKLTPREAFRLMDFPDTFDFSIVSNTQAYKMAGNSVVVACYYHILKNLL